MFRPRSNSTEGREVSQLPARNDGERLINFYKFLGKSCLALILFFDKCQSKFAKLLTFLHRPHLKSLKKVFSNIT